MDKYSIQQVTKSLKIAMVELCTVKLHVIGSSSVQAWTFSGFSVTAKVSFWFYSTAHNQQKTSAISFS